jgi:large subunit ribosomal protein L24
MAANRTVKQYRRLSVKKGDQVVVISGRDADYGKVGKVIRVLPKTNRVVVEGVAMVTRHQKPTMQGQKGSLVRQEAPIHRSRVMIYDPSLKKGVRVRNQTLENGQKVRVSHKSGETLDT